MLTPEIRSDVCAYLGGICREMNGVALIVNGTSDHLHLLLRLPAVNSVAEIARVLKTNSSRWIHERWTSHRNFAWQTGYGAFSVSESSASAVTKYIATQEQHHERRTFQEEFREFLKKNGISVDEKYLWG